MSDTPEIPAPLTVSAVSSQAKFLLESHFDQVRVEGEIGDFTAAGSGHWYFTLKDEEAQIRCAMFRGANGRVRFRPGRGDNVQVRGRISLYTPRGEFQLIVQHMQAAGDGALQLRFEQLKAKLKSEGLFDSDRKQSVPEDARRVGVITSASGAALHDILAVIERRSPMTQVFLYPVPVQGTEAAPALVAAVQQANALHESQAVPPDVLIVGRGGGSAEDLWAFNDEALAHAIADSTLPIVSAVGHEVDFSISDFVADQRAATPSAAAELVTLDTMEWMQRLDDIQRLLQNTVKRRFSHAQNQLGHLRARLRHPGVVLAQQQQLLAGQQQRLNSLIKNRIDQGKTSITHLSRRLHARHPMQKLVDLRSRLADRQQRLQRRQRQILERLSTGLAQQQQLLRSLGPDNTLARGYALVTDAKGKIIRRASATEPGDGIRVRLAEGGLQAQVTAVTEPEAES